MATMSLVERDVVLEDAVKRELDLDPAIDAQAVRVIVRDGFVTLNGTIPTRDQRAAAERTARRVAGVRQVANAITVRVDRCCDEGTRDEVC